MDNRAIGVYDSGVGGLTVLSSLIKVLPKEEYIYFGDTKNLPYGTKTKEELIKISTAIFDFFKQKNVKAVVMACNTTSSMVYEEMKKKYDFEIYPIIQTSAKCIAENCTGAIGVMATPATISTNKYKEELLKHNSSLKVYQEACPELVKIVESGYYDSIENLEIIKAHLKPLVDNGCRSIILGCTHYPYLTEILEKLTNNEINFINPATYFTDFIKQDLEAKQILCEKALKTQSFYVSSNPEQFKSNAQNFYKLPSSPQIYEL